MIRKYSELRRLETFDERFEYLTLKGVVGEKTFGHERWMNQRFYTSREWRLTRDDVIARDLGCDLGVPGFEIHDRVFVHHMNPMTRNDVAHSNEDNLNPDYLITVSFDTHNAIHYGDPTKLVKPTYVERRPGDTILWERS